MIWWCDADDNVLKQRATSIVDMSFLCIDHSNFTYHSIIAEHYTPK